MKKSINWKLFFILLGISEAVTLMVLPYTLALSPEVAKLFTPVVMVAQLVQSLILFAIAIYFGLLLSKRVGLGLPILEKIIKGEKYGDHLRSILGISLRMGAIAAVLIIAMDLIFSMIMPPLLKIETSIPIWKPLLASFYGGIGEEILLRLFLVTVFVWISSKIKKTSAGKPTTLGIWIAIILSSIIFGLGHLPITSTLTAITPVVIARAILLNGAGGVIFGWLYWKKGLESAIISHFSCDIGIHIIYPLILSLFV